MTFWLQVQCSTVLPSCRLYHCNTVWFSNWLITAYFMRRTWMKRFSGITKFRKVYPAASLQEMCLMFSNGSGKWCDFLNIYIELFRGIAGGERGMHEVNKLHGMKYLWYARLSGCTLQYLLQNSGDCDEIWYIVPWINLPQSHVNVFHLTWIMSLHYLVKLEMLIAHVLQLSC